MKLYYYENGQFEKATGASIFAESNNSNVVQFKLPMVVEGSVVYATFLLPFSQNTDQYGQYKAESLLLTKKVDEEDGGFMYEGLLAEGYLVNNGTAYICARIQAPEGLATYTASSASSITIGEKVYTISYTSTTPALLKLTDTDSNVFQSLDNKSIMVDNAIFLIGEDENEKLTLTTDLTIKTTEQVQFKIQAGGGYSATAVLPEFGQQLALAIANIETELYNLNQNKQDKVDAGINTSQSWQTSTTVVTAINNIISQVAINKSDIATNTNNIAQNTSDISYLYSHMAQPEEYIGQMTGSSLPTNAQLTQFVEDTAGREPKNADVVIFVLQIAGETDKNYKYIYAINGWNGYEIPPIESADNDSLGLIEGTYNIGSTNETIVDISGGQILNIYVKDGTDTYRNIREYLNTTTTNIANIISGSTSVGLALKAISDSFGNNIVNTYLTQTSGATKQYVRDYSLPREFNDIYFISADGYTNEVPTTPASGIQFTIETDSVGDHQIFQISKQESADYELSNKNSARTVIYVASDADCDVQFRLTTQAQLSGGAWKTLSIYLTEQISLSAGVITKVDFSDAFTSLENEVITVTDGDYLRQTLEVVTQTSSALTFDVYSNSTYSSRFSLNTQTTVVKTLAGNIGQEQSLIAVGSAVTGGIDFKLPSDTLFADDTSVEFTLVYVGTVLDTDIITISLAGQTVVLKTPYNISSGDVLGKYLKQCYFETDGSRTEIRFKGFVNVNSGDNITIKIEEDNFNALKRVESISAGGTALTPDANQNVNIPIASDTDAGVIKVKTYSTSGLLMEDGFLSTYPASITQINNKTNTKCQLTPDNIDLITKIGVTTNTVLLTDQEKQTAQTWLGINYSNPNILINGDFSINQRGLASYSGSSLTYTVDRFFINRISSLTVNANNTITITNPNNYGIFGQRIEDYNKFKGKTLTLTVKISSFSLTTGAPKISLRDSVSATTTNITGVGTFTVTRNINSNTTLLEARVFYNDSTNSSDAVVTIEYAKLEIGEVATPFSPRPYAEELALCQRYYVKFGGTTQVNIGLGFSNAGGNSIYPQITLPTTMRPYYTLSFSSMGIQTYNGATVSNVTLSGINTTNTEQQPNVIRPALTVDGTVPASTLYELRIKANENFVIDAEIY